MKPSLPLTEFYITFMLEFNCSDGHGSLTPNCEASHSYVSGVLVCGSSMFHSFDVTLLAVPLLMVLFW